ncbi:MAG TPA: M20/M25/M40 family metallo-hydrolase, partial [Terriglobales bacterium]|nr:M20/M25/M40 family metallo-hydrolase [Terriglobales bacterium]
MTMKRFTSITVSVVAVLLAILALRALTFSSRQLKPSPLPPLAFNETAAVERLSKAIQYRTVSGQDALPPAAEFSRFGEFLAASFPSLHTRVSRETVGEHSLLYTWKGKNDTLKPILLMGHLDVVPVEPSSEASWRHPPFAGAIADGFIWGRGSMDDKAAVMGILEAVENLVNAGYEPERTIYLAFGHDEEIGGARGAAKIAELLRSRG